MDKELQKNIEQIVDGELSKISKIFIRITGYGNKNNDDKAKIIDKIRDVKNADDSKPKSSDKDANNSTPKYNFINFGKTLILNECFINSKFTLYGNNIVHETINCFKADNGKRYFYLCKEGTISRDYFEIDASLSFKKNYYLNKNKLIYLEYSKTSKNDDGKDQYVFIRKADKIEIFEAAYKNKLDQIDYNNIEYGGVNICHIFDNNSYPKKNTTESLVQNLCDDNYPIKAYITFEA